MSIFNRPNIALVIVIIALFALPFILAGCAVTYKGVAVYVNQKAGNNAYADQDSVPDHQQGSDVLVPVLKEIGKAYRLKMETLESIVKECLDAENPEACKGYQVPDIPEIPAPTPPNPDPGPVPPPDNGNPPVPTPNSSWAGGNLYKSKSDSRGGLPVVLTKSSASDCKNFRLFHDTDEIPVVVEYRGRTNGNRPTYFMLDKKAEDLPKDLIVDVCEQTFLVPDPTVERLE
jgi:hypothetical protein